MKKLGTETPSLAQRKTIAIRSDMSDSFGASGHFLNREKTIINFFTGSRRNVSSLRGSRQSASPSTSRPGRDEYRRRNERRGWRHKVAVTRCGPEGPRAMMATFRRGRGGMPWPASANWKSRTREGASPVSEFLPVCDCRRDLLSFSESAGRNRQATVAQLL